MTGEEIADLFARLLQAARAHGDLGWRPIHGEVAKLDPTRDPAVLANIRDYYHGGFGLDPRDYFPDAGSEAEMVARGGAAADRVFGDVVVDPDSLDRMFRNSRAYVEKVYPRFLPVFDRVCIDPVASGGPRGYLDTFVSESGPLPTCHASIGVAVRVVSLMAALEKYKPFHGVGPTGRMLEIGGGHGHLLKSLAEFHRGGQLIAVDLPANLMATHLYFERHFPGAVGRFWFDDDRIDPSARLVTVAPWKLRELPVADTIALNFRSFQHMDRANHTFYSDALKAIGCKAVYHLNRDVVRDPTDLRLDDYPLRGWMREMARSVAPLEFNTVFMGDEAVSLYLVEELLIRDQT